MNRLLIIIWVLLFNSALAQNLITFPDNIKNYKVKEVSNNQTTLQLVLFDKEKFKKMHLNQEDLITDANDLTNKISDYFKPINSNNPIQQKTKKIKKITNFVKEDKKENGYLLITKYFFVEKDKPYQLEINEENEDLQQQIYKESQCKDGICSSHIIMGINYFDTDFKIKPLEINKFADKLKSKDENIIHANYEQSQPGILKIYYFYGINGEILPQNKDIIKNMIQESKK